ncbi:MAG TPA: glycosyltransferase [Pseudonocardiaceae bacterium]|nr:glycosyltransferase [Pseudonocardiaceae bacterium]
MPERPVRVGTVITRFAGGAGQLALRGILAMDREAFPATVVTGDPGRLATLARDAGVEVIVVPELRAPIAPRDDVLALRRLIRLLRQYRFDVVHTHCAKAGTLGRIAARRAATPWVVHTYHGFPFHRFQSMARRHAYVTVERRLGRLTDRALCVGTAVAAEAARRRLVAPDRIRTIGVVVDHDGPTRDSESIRAARGELGLPRDAVVVGTVGRLTYQKAPEHFVAALARLRRPDVVGVWIGDGELADRTAALARSTPGVRMVFAGERTDVPALLPAFDVFAMASRYEGLPTAVVEAMVAGVPVVATAVNAVTDVVEPGRTGLLVPPGHPALLGDAIGYLLDRPDRAAAFAATARARLGDRFTSATLRDALARAYRDDQSICTTGHTLALLPER